MIVISMWFTTGFCEIINRSCAAGLKPFDGDRQHFFSEMRKLLEANVEQLSEKNTRPTKTRSYPLDPSGKLTGRAALGQLVFFGAFCSLRLVHFCSCAMISERCKLWPIV
jgi:hypothetical protein